MTKKAIIQGRMIKLARQMLGYSTAQLANLLEESQETMSRMEMLIDPFSVAPTIKRKFVNAMKKEGIVFTNDSVIWIDKEKESAAPPFEEDLTPTVTGNKVKEARRRFDMSRATFAELCGITVGVLSLIEDSRDQVIEQPYYTRKIVAACAREGLGLTCDGLIWLSNIHEGMNDPRQRVVTVESLADPQAERIKELKSKLYDVLQSNAVVNAIEALIDEKIKQAIAPTE